MDAIKHLLHEHEQIKDLFSQFKAAGERAHKKKQTIAEKLIKVLHSHSQQEEKVFYPAVFAKADKEYRELILEGIEEHRVADFMIDRLQKTKPEDEVYDARFDVLTESVKHHLQEEESKLFPRAKKLLEGELDALGDQMEVIDKKMEG